MSEKTPPVKRPALITAVSVMLFSATVFNIIYTFTGVYAPYGIYYSALNAFIMVIMIAALSGVWVMEKWGVYLFTLTMLIKFCVDIYSGAFTWWLLLLLVPVILFFSQLRKMN